MSRYSKFILKSIKEKFEAEEKYETEGFPDLNYEVGNTSGLDIAPGVPSAMDERIGSLSQRGGSVMEVIINNPATFQLDKDRMFNVINQLGINISIHSNPDVGYTSAYRGRYDPTHDYFTKYLKEFAIFKKEAETRANDEENFGFEIQRINPHISTTPLPALEEERAQDTGLDPFGYSLTDLKESKMDEKDSEGKNIFRNEEFLRRLFRTFVLDFMEGNEYRYFEQVFSDYSDGFDNEWKEAQDQILNKIFKQRAGDRNEDPVMDKAMLLGAGGAGDANVSTEWYQYLETDVEPTTLEINPPIRRGEDTGRSEFEIESLEDLDKFTQSINPNYQISTIRRLPEIYRLLSQGNIEKISRADREIGNQEELAENIKEPLEEAITEIWTEKEDDGEPLITVQNKIRAIARHFEMSQQRIIERAFEGNKEELFEAAEDAFAGDPDYFEEESEDEKPETIHLKFLQQITRQFQQQMWMESNIMYKIIPAWMSVANEGIEDDSGDTVHSGWQAPEFLWELLVKQKWEEKGYDIDLTNPRGDEDEDVGYLDLLENSREFQADVAAASAGTYVWGHFTQKEARFDIEYEQTVENREVETTWIDWMNQYGIGVNLEAMPGSPQQMYKIWRPKDIVAAARAINITARNDLDEIHEDLDEMPAKFTIDLEHTATFGLDPWKTMEELIEQEEGLAESELADKYNVKIDRDKPLAKVLRMWHLMRAGLETSQSQTLHGPWDRGDTQLYTWLYKMIDAGFCRNPDETAYIMYEVGGDDRGTVYTARIAMNLIELGVSPDDLDPASVDPSKKNYGDEKEALMARFFGMDKSTYDREWAKIEEHAFDPLEGLLEAEQFDYTWSGQAAIQNDNRPQEWMQEEFK